jgi:hypothetical protein
VVNVRGRNAGSAGAQPLSPQRKWQTITVATLVLVPAYWAILAGLVSQAAENGDDPSPHAGLALAFGLMVIPFVFMILAFMSGHPRAPAAVLKAMGLSILVGIVVSAAAVDAVTGIVAGVGAGGVVALRQDDPSDRKARWLGVLVAALYTFALVRVVGALALFPAPIFPFTAIGLADHLAARRREREAAER